MLASTYVCALQNHRGKRTFRQFLCSNDFYIWWPFRGIITLSVINYTQSWARLNFEKKKKDTEIEKNCRKSWNIPDPGGGCYLKTCFPKCCNLYRLFFNIKLCIIWRTIETTFFHYLKNKFFSNKLLKCLDPNSFLNFGNLLCISWFWSTI